MPTHSSAFSPSSSSVVRLAAKRDDLNMNRFTSMPIRSSTSLHSLPPSSLAVSAALRGGGAGAAGTSLGPAIALNMAVGCILASVADLMAQSSKLDFGSDRRHFQNPYLLALRGTGEKGAKLRRRINTIKRELRTINLTRTAGFALFGIAIKGIVQFFWYGYLLTPLSRGSVPLAVLLDMGVYMPLVYFPLYYACTGAFQNSGSLSQSLEESMKKYFSNFWPANRASWTFWVPLQFLNFLLVPIEYRNLVVLTFAFLWTVILSLITD